jgi:hypothetical protein
MRARRLIEGSTLTAETLGVAFAAFESAWAEIASQYVTDPDDARAKLAHAILLVTQEGARDAKRLKDEALQIFRLNGRV